MAQTSDATPSSPPPPSSYRVKSIVYGTKVVSICMQNENGTTMSKSPSKGPCPLLAICNVLLLKGEMFIHPDQSFVTLDELLNQLSACIMKKKPLMFTSDGEQRNYEANIAAAMATFSELSRGLDVNVHFSGVFAFEFTVQAAIFDLVGIPLCHGWLPDPNDPAYDLVRVGSYNSLVEKIVSGSVALDQLHKQESEMAVASSSTSPDVQVPEATSSSSSAPPPSSSNSADAPSREEIDVTVIQHGQAIRRWMDETASQLTFHGLMKLHEQINESQLCVFFRNNHFSTIVMHEASLWSLVTDQGYTKQVGIVWEKLDSTTGDTVFATSSFDVFKGTEQDLATLPDMDAIKLQQQQEHGDLYGYGVGDENDASQTKLDEELARQLQESENRKAAKARPLAQTQPPKSAPANPKGGRSLNRSAPGGPPDAGYAAQPKQDRVRREATSQPPNGSKAKASKDKDKDKDDDCVIL